MTELIGEKCRICLTTNKYDNISDSSCYAEFFNQFLRVSIPIEKLWLCMWCKATLKKAVALFTLALESEKMLQAEITLAVSSKKLYDFNYVKTSHIDILDKPQVDQHEITEEIMDFENTIKIENIESPAEDIVNKIEIPKKRNKKNMKTKLSENLNSINKSRVKDEIEIEKKIKNNLNIAELNFEVEFLNLEEQLKEVELKRVKYKQFKFQCSDCGLGFLSSNVFEEHKVRHSQSSGSYSCNICGLHFKSQEVLSQHTLAHRRRFKCMLCGTVFKRWQHCIAHRYKCGGVVDPVACEECFKIFNNEHSLKVHKKIHKREKKYVCDQCCKKFVSKQRLTVHIRSHTGQKPYSCNICDRSFSTSSNLRAHISVHSDDNRHYCVECHTYYKTAKSLKRHFNESARHRRENTEMYSCKDCTKQFSSEKSLKYHTNTRHVKEYQCALCNKTFSNNSNLNKHIKCIHTTT